MISSKARSNGAKDNASIMWGGSVGQDPIKQVQKRQRLKRQVGEDRSGPGKKGSGPGKGTGSGNPDPPPAAPKDDKTTSTAPTEAVSSPVLLPTSSTEIILSSTSVVEVPVRTTTNTPISTSLVQSSSSSVQSSSSLVQSSSSFDQSTTSIPSLLTPTTLLPTIVTPKSSSSSTSAKLTETTSSSVIIPVNSTVSRSSSTAIKTSEPTRSLVDIYNKTYTTSAGPASKSSASQGIDSKTISVTPSALVGIITGLIVFALAIVLALIFVTRRRFRQCEANALSTHSFPPSSPLLRFPSFQQEMSYSHDAPQKGLISPHIIPPPPPPRLQMFRSSIFQPLSSHPANDTLENDSRFSHAEPPPPSITATTIDTGDIFPPSTASFSFPTSAPMQRRNIFLPDGSIQTIAMSEKAMPAMPAIPQRAHSGRAREIMIRPSNSSHKVNKSIQSTRIFTPALYGGVVNIEPPESSSKSETESTSGFYAGPTDSDDAATDAMKARENRTTFGLLKPPQPGHQPAGRWSDPFTLAWRGSGEADGGGTRWKTAKSWVESQNGRLYIKDGN